MNTSRHPRIAIVAAGPDIIGGQGVQATALVNALRGDGYDVTFLPINPQLPAGLGWLRRAPYVRTVANQSLYLPSLARLADVDVVHAFSASYASFLLAPAPAMVAGRLLRKRVVLHYHSGEADDHLARWGALVHPWLRLAHEIVVPSAYLQGVFTRHGYRTRVIPNVVDVARFAFRERTTVGPRFLSARNLEPIYRVDVVLQAFARVTATCPAATLIVAGHGREETRLRRLAESLACEDRVQFVGKIDPEAMPRLYAEADIFLNASVVDNQPVSILEAFASGLPVVSTPTGDIASMVRHGDTGLIVPADDPAALAAAAHALLGDPHRARNMARRARQEIDRYTWSAVRDGWASAYHDSPNSQVPSPKAQTESTVASPQSAHAVVGRDPAWIP